MTTVIVAEKPDQARAYMKGLGIRFEGKASSGRGTTFLDQDTQVVAAAGHLIELSEPEKYDEAYKERNNMDILPLIPPKFLYTIPKGKSFYFMNIKKHLVNANQIVVATDKDDEGCAIAFNILLFCGVLGKGNIKRAYPSAMNKEAVVRQFKNLEDISATWKHANAAIARSRSDWLIGMNLSRLYTHKLSELGIYGNFAIGRAISTTLNLICQWYKEIQDFEEQPIFELEGEAEIESKKIPLTSSLKVVGNKDINAKHEYIRLLKQHNILQADLPGVVKEVLSQPKEGYPPILMTKGDLYREMNRVAGWSQSKSKKVMQKNYEQGYQTYPRTDSGKITKYMYDYLFRLFNNYLQAIGEENSDLHAVRYDDAHLKKYLTSEASAGAHLGIIPTEKIMGSQDDVSDEQRLMWEVVVRKSLTVVMQPYKYVSNNLTLLVKDVPMKAHNTVILESGWKQVLLPSKKKKKSQTLKEGFDFSKVLAPKQVINVHLKNAQSKTEPLKPLKSIQIYDKGGLMEHAYKYVDDEKYAKLLKESKGIGTSATRDQAMASLTQKKFVTVDKKDIISVTPSGWLINKLLMESQVNDPLLTAQWEEEYKLIGEGIHNADGLINATAKLVYTEFQRVESNWDIEEIKKYYQGENSKFIEQESLGDCPVCGSPVLFKKTKKFSGYDCSNKDCKFGFFAEAYGKQLSETNVRKLLAMKQTNLIKGMSDKTGRHFEGHLILKPVAPNGDYRIRIVKAQETQRKFRRRNRKQ